MKRMKRVLMVLLCAVLLGSTLNLTTLALTVGIKVGKFDSWSYYDENGFPFDKPNYSAYVKNLKDKLNSTVLANGAVRIYFECHNIERGSTDYSYSFSDVVTGFSFGASVHSKAPNSKFIRISFVPITLPFSCTYKYGSQFLHSAHIGPSPFLSKDASGGQGYSARPFVDGNYADFPLDGSVAYGFFLGNYYIDCTPTANNLPDLAGVDTSSKSRPVSIKGSIGYLNQNGDMTVVEHLVINEAAKTFTDPSTGTVYNLTDWAYDYSDRSYSVTTDSGDIGKVMYGDENLSITLKNSKGDTITNNYYYLEEEPGGGSGGGEDPGGGGTDEPGGGGENPGGGSDDDESGGLWGKLGELVGKVLKGIVSFFSAIVSNLLDALISLVELLGAKLLAVVDGLSNFFQAIPQIFTGLVGFMGAVFAFLPEELNALLFFGLFAFLFVGLVLRIIGR